MAVLWIAARACVPEVVRAVRTVWEGPLFVRISATDWVEGGWNIDESVKLARMLKLAGVDLMDVSSGGMVPGAKIPTGPGFQTPLAARIRREAEIPTAVVGIITDTAQAEQIVRNGDADLVMPAREMLRDPYWALHSAVKQSKPAPWPVQYLRAAPAGTPPRTPLPPPQAGWYYQNRRNIY